MSKSIIVEGLSKKFRIHHEKERDTERRSLLGKLLGGSPEKENGASDEDFWALRDISFEVDRGERLAIVGRNGAGKSTLLKILSRVMSPTEGRIQIRGRLSSLLEVGTGFHPDLTGRENVFLNGAVLGMSRSEVRRKFDAIVNFAEVERFIDTPVKYYSSGMYVRLAFSVSAFLEPDIVVLDEVLSVGDSRFQKKSFQKMRDLAIDGRTVIFVSHSVGAVRALCSKAILLEGGIVQAYGAVDDVMEKYEEAPKPFAGLGQVSLEAWRDREGPGTLARVVSGRIDVLPEKSEIRIGDSLRFTFCVSFAEAVLGKRVKMSLVLRTGDGFPIANMVTDDSRFEIANVGPVETISITLKDVIFYPGTYNVGFWVGDIESATHDFVNDCMAFQVSSGGELAKRHLPLGAGLLFLTPDWSRR
jgi:lipopolysaccharide transport system ATP-binding protein